jgi:HEAT repeat protein
MQKEKSLDRWVMRLAKCLLSGYLWVSAYPLWAQDALSGAQLQIKRLGKEYADVYQQEAQAALIRQGTPVLSLLIEALDDPDHSRRIRVLEVLGELRDKRAIPHLLRVFERSGNSQVRCKVMEALGKMREPSLFTFIVTHLQDPDSHLYCFAIWALGEQRSRKAIPYLVKILASDQGYSLVTAIDALGKSGTADQAPMLLEFLKYESTQTRYVAAKALGEIGDGRSASAVFQAMLQEPDLEVQDTLARTHGKIGGEEGITRLVELIKKESSPTIQRVAAVSLQAAGLQASFYLMPLLKSEDLRSKMEAARILGLLKAPGAVRPLLDMMGDSDKTVQLVAIVALGDCGDTSTIRPLTKMARSRDAALRSAAAEALKKIAGRNEELYQQAQRKS